jgi:serine/threonine-protein kinase
MTAQIVSHYRLGRILGRGGMGVVYLAEDIQLRRSAAVKLLSGDSLAAGRQHGLLREAQAAAALDHPNICTVYEFGEDAGHPFMAMAYVEGETLRQRIESARPWLPIDTVISFGRQLLAGLAHAHSRGVVHRDLKTSNVMVNADGVLKITDFGIAILMGDGTTATVPDAGTPAFMSPEQVDGRPLDHRTDLWSWGVVMYQMLTGRLPFESDNRLALFEAIAVRSPMPVPALRPDVPGDVIAVVARALQKEREHRWQSAADAERALRWIGSAADRVSALPPGVSTMPTVVVLPFANLNAEPESDFFSDGLTDELTHVLGRVHGLRLIARTSAYQFKGRMLDVRELSSALGVTHVVEGAVRRAGARLRVTAGLVSAVDGCQLWSGHWDRDSADVLTIQHELSTRIAKALRLSLKAPPATRMVARVARAHSLYLHGRYCWHQQTESGFQRALGYFERALQEDPDCALAYTGIADLYGMLGFWSAAPPKDVWPKARDAALKALELNPSLVEAHTSLVYVHLFQDWDVDAAGERLAQALALVADNPGALYAKTVHLMQLGRQSEALKTIQRVSALDPLSPMMATAVAWSHCYLKDFEQASKECRRALALDDTYAEAHVVLGLAAGRLSGRPASIPHLEQAANLTSNNPLVLGVLGQAYAEVDRSSDARRSLAILQEISRSRYVAPVSLALIHAGLGELDTAFAVMAEAIRMRDGLVRYLPVSPIFDGMRSDDRFPSLLRDAGF